MIVPNENTNYNQSKDAKKETNVPKQKGGNVENANEILQEISDESFENWFNSIKESQATELKSQDVDAISDLLNLSGNDEEFDAWLKLVQNESQKPGKDDNLNDSQYEPSEKGKTHILVKAIATAAFFCLFFHLLKNTPFSFFISD